MSTIEKEIQELVKQLQALRSRQVQMNTELEKAELTLQSLQAELTHTIHHLSRDILAPTPVREAAETPYIVTAQKKIEQNKRAVQQPRSFQEIENFIGSNLTSKIGILITIVGVFIGAKYAIDNELISPFLRIAAGYAVAAALAVIALRLKGKYEHFSSVLIGGALAVTYFITYIAYDFYALLSMTVAFAVMVATTGATVGIALWYNQKIIALLGQVAAYAIPFLLSTGQGNTFVLFSYISLINVGLLFLSFKKDWKLLYHIAFFLTWLIYLFLILAGKISSSFTAGLTFLAINFFTFYTTFLAYKILRKEMYRLSELSILLTNALFFFFIGNYLIDRNFNNVHYFTWFTIANAAVHLAIGYFIYKLKLVDNTVFQFIAGLGLLFITITIPIELDGSWVTVLWTLEATILFNVAIRNNRNLYLEIAAPLILISLVSLSHDWLINYDFTIAANPITPFANINFFLSLFVATCFGYMAYNSTKIAHQEMFLGPHFYTRVVPVVFLVMLYFLFANELNYAWELRVHGGNVEAVLCYKEITLLIFTFFYFTGWFLLNRKIFKDVELHAFLVVFSLLANIIFLGRGLSDLGKLRELYLQRSSGIQLSIFVTRYFSFAALAALWLSARNSFHFFRPSIIVKRSFSVLFNITFLAIISNEFIHWMDLSGYQNEYKLGLSLIWGGYALAMLFAGMLKRKKHLRFSAMILFTCTLLKLFFYDLVSLSTISKTIVLVLLGVLLLMASFLYNKYKDLLFTNDETSN